MSKREIKFRVWDTLYSCWHSKDSLVVATNNQLVGLGTFIGNPTIDIPHISSGIVEYLQKRYVLDQFTGLLDKNGKEIYEGDILECAGVPDGYGDDYRTVYAMIIFDPATGGFKADRKIYGRSYSGNGDSAGHFWRYVVIGNIHENPDLLK